MTFIDILRQHQSELLKHYGGQLSSEQRRGIKAMLSCRQNTDRVSRWHCDSCNENTEAPLSCGHRHCPQCQHHTTSEWLARQQQKRLPVNYFMVTFTVPYELRALIKANAKRVYPMFFKVAASVLKDFAARKKTLQGQIGFTGVLHTHSRQRDYHPHLHFILPAGSYHSTTEQWHKHKGKYLFNVHNLANVWRARLLETLKHTLSLPLPAGMKQSWVVHCAKVGQGAPALKYLSRYLYRGVLPDKAIVKVTAETVSFRYQDSATKQSKIRTLPILKFLMLILQHILPKGLRRVRDYGLLQGCNYHIIQQVQLLLRVNLPTTIETSRPCCYRACPCCHEPMLFKGILMKKVLNLA